jgi:hypothetical protein
VNPNNSPSPVQHLATYEKRIRITEINNCLAIIEDECEGDYDLILFKLKGRRDMLKKIIGAVHE